MCKQLIACAVLVSAVAVFPPRASSEEKDAKQSYYKTLKSLLRPQNLRVRPKNVPPGRDINLIDPEKGALGVFFGESMDKVVEVWGKPSSLHILGSLRPWDLSMGAHRFGFRDNELVSISVHCATSSGAHLKGGIGFKSSLADVEKAFGKPAKKGASTLTYELPKGYSLGFHFVAEPDLRRNGKGGLKLITISIYHPDAGR